MDVFRKLHIFLQSEIEVNLHGSIRIIYRILKVVAHDVA